MDWVTAAAVPSLEPATCLRAAWREEVHMWKRPERMKPLGRIGIHGTAFVEAMAAALRAGQATGAEDYFDRTPFAPVKDQEEEK